jgi:hypothetical protein
MDKQVIASLSFLCQGVVDVGGIHVGEVNGDGDALVNRFLQRKYKRLPLRVQGRNIVVFQPCNKRFKCDVQKQPKSKHGYRYDGQCKHPFVSVAVASIPIISSKTSLTFKETMMPALTQAKNFT